MPRLTCSKREALRQAIELEKVCFAGVQLLNADLRASESKTERARIATAIGGLCRNWTGIRDSVRVMKGEPLPSGSAKKATRQRMEMPARPAVIYQPDPADNGQP